MRDRPIRPLAGPLATTLSCFFSILLLLLIPAFATGQHHRRKDWPTYGGSFSQQRFSRLFQVNRRNVSKLEVKWTFAVPDAGIIDNSLQTTPLVVRGHTASLPRFDAVMFVTSPRNRVIALDAATGEPIWEFQASLDEKLKLCCSSSNRGVAFGRVKVRRGVKRTRPLVYLAALDARLWAIDAATGRAGRSPGRGDAGS